MSGALPIIHLPPGPMPMGGSIGQDPGKRLSEKYRNIQRKKELRKIIKAETEKERPKSKKKDKGFYGHMKIQTLF